MPFVRIHNKNWLVLPSNIVGKLKQIDYKLNPRGFQMLKYLWYVDNIMSSVIGSKQDALEMQRVVQNFIKEELKLDMHE
jgi:polygalacturonase